MLYMRVTFRRVEVGRFRYWQALLDNGYFVTGTQGFARKAECRATARDRSLAVGRVPLFMN